MERSVSKFPLDFIIGASVEFAIGVSAAAIGTGALLGVIGGVIGEWIQGSPSENFKINFMNLSSNQKRKEVKNIFKQYGNVKW